MASNAEIKIIEATVSNGTHTITVKHDRPGEWGLYGMEGMPTYEACNGLFPDTFGAYDDAREAARALMGMESTLDYLSADALCEIRKLRAQWKNAEAIVDGNQVAIVAKDFVDLQASDVFAWVPMRSVQEPSHPNETEEA